MQSLGVVKPYWRCGHLHQFRIEAVIGEAVWRLPDASGRMVERTGPACPKCGSWLEQRERTEYPVVTRPDEVVEGGVYFVEHDYHNVAPFGGDKFRVVMVPDWRSDDRDVVVRLLDPRYDRGLQTVSLYKLGIVDPRHGHRNIHNTTYRFA